jgi:hypothetical protein
MMSDSKVELTQDGLNARCTVTTGNQVTKFRLDGTGEAACEQIALLHGEIEQRNQQLVALWEKWTRRGDQARGEWYSDYPSIEEMLEDLADILKTEKGWE